ncbi:MAG TPA: CDP-archaeol synthase [Methyloceanibacter sp.]|nr:CDP-archaeol synthase [Methyloceanibacter sp.]
MHPALIAQLLVLVTLANAMPLLAKKALGRAWAWPLDGGATFIDGRPLLGASKTVRGLVVSLLATALVSSLMGLGWKLGLILAACAMAGDLLSSFTKRRMGLPPSSKALGLDQIPESLLPLLAASWLVPITLLDIAAGTAIFFVGGLAVSRLLFKLNLRDEPY